MNSVKKKLVIHIGTHKTGTTSIQNSLGASRKALLKEGIYYPDLLPYNHGFNFIQLFKRNPQEFIRYIQKDLTSEEIHQDLAYLDVQWRNQFQQFQQGTFIISGEALSHLHSDEIIKLKQFVEPYFDEVIILVYIRPFISFISSMVQQMVKQGLYSLNECSDFTKGLISPLTFTESIKHWISIFGEANVIIRPFNSNAFCKGNLLADFLGVIGYEDFNMSLIAESNMNESIGENVTAILSELNAKYPLIKDGKVNKERGLAKQILPRRVYARVQDEKFKLDIQLNEQEAKLFNEAIRFFNGYLPKEFLLPEVTVSNSPMTFPTAENIKPNFYAELLNEYHKEIELHYKTHVFHEKLFSLAGTNKQIYIWGAGAGGLKIKELLANLNLEISGFIDSNPIKTGTMLEGKAIYQPSILKSYEVEQIYVIVSSVYFKEIVKDLEIIGLKEHDNFLVKYMYW